MRIVPNNYAKMLCTLTGVPGGPCGPGIGVASAPLTYTICDAKKVPL